MCCSWLACTEYAKPFGSWFNRKIYSPQTWPLTTTRYTPLVAVVWELHAILANDGRTFVEARTFPSGPAHRRWLIRRKDDES
jgi:hypothetical protein